MFAVIESLMCDQFDHLMMICHVCCELLLQIRNTPGSWQGGGRQSGLSDAAFCRFLWEQLTATQTAQAAGELSLVLLHIV